MNCLFFLTIQFDTRVAKKDNMDVGGAKNDVRDDGMNNKFSRGINWQQMFLTFSSLFLNFFSVSMFALLFWHNFDTYCYIWIIMRMKEVNLGFKNGDAPLGLSSGICSTKPCQLPIWQLNENAKHMPWFLRWKKNVV